METKHTPGPWIAQQDPNGRGDDWVVGIGDAAPIDYVATCWKRDAKLIESAPLLYIFAKEIAIGAYTTEEAAVRARDLLRKCCDV